MEGSEHVKIKLTKKQANALLSTFDSAQRGRDDFEYLAGRDAGDYSKGDIKRARKWHQREIAVETLVAEQIEQASKPKPLNGETLVATIVQMPGDEGAQYTLRLPNHPDMLIGDAQDEYGVLAAILDGEYAERYGADRS